MELPQSARISAPAITRTWLLRLAQFAALALAIILGWQGYQLVLDHHTNIDEAARWFTAALVLLAIFAWDRATPAVAAWPSRIVTYVRAHPLELIGVAAAVGVALLMRLYTWGELPPSGYLCCEEHISGGVGWGILQGERPYAFAIVRYSVALGLWLFGPSTTGLRFVMFAAGVLAVVPFYLIMREAVDRPAALFATVLFACLRFSYISMYFQTPLLFTLLFVWTTLRTLKTGNALWAVPAGALAALISYEYEAFKAVPLLLGVFAACLAARVLLWPLPSPREFGLRVQAFAMRWPKPALVFAVALLIVLSPMMAERSRGVHIYVSSLNRQLSDRDARGDSGFFAPNAPDQLRYAVEAYTPMIDQSYLSDRVAHIRLVDGATSILMWIAVVASVATFWRGWRLAFLLWFGGGVLMSALLLSNFAEWKLMGFLPAGIALIGIITNDALRSLRGETSRHVAYGALIALAAVIVALNLRVLSQDADSALVAKTFANTPSETFALCDYLRGRPDDNFSLITSRSPVIRGFSADPQTPAEIERAFGDYSFVCEGLEGVAIETPLDVPFAPGQPERAYTLLFVGPSAQARQWSASMESLFPEIGEPDVVREGPADIFRLIAYETTPDELAARRGLLARAISPSGDVVEERVTADGDPSPLARAHPEASIELLGVAYFDRAYDALAISASETAPVEVIIDGISHESGGAPTSLGWHSIHARWQQGATPSPLLIGHSGSLLRPVDASHALALDDATLWRHIRTFASAEGERIHVSEFDFGPRYISPGLARIEPDEPLPEGWTVESDTWIRRWTIDDGGDYIFKGETREGPITIAIDGTPVATQQNHFDAQTTIEPGAHILEVTYAPGVPDRDGGLLTVITPDGTWLDVSTLRPPDE